MPGTEVRLAVAEARIEAVADLVKTNQEQTAKVLEKLDEHITMCITRDDLIHQNLTQITVAVTGLSNNVMGVTAAIENLTPVVEQSKIELLKARSFIRAASIILSAVVLLISAGWAVYTFHFDEPVVVITTPAQITK